MAGSEEIPELAKPLLRGVLHQYAFPVFAGLGIALVVTASGTLERVAAAVFAASVTLAFGLSALYHRVAWTPSAWRVMRRLDHAGIYLLIAGTYTPFGLLVLSGTWRYSILGVVWIGAALAIAQRFIWLDGPNWVAAAFAVGLGWVGVVAFPKMVAETGVWGTALLITGGALYTLGAVVYTRRRPDPIRSVFGYHELFHMLTVLAAGSHYAAVAFFVL